MTETTTLSELEHDLVELALGRHEREHASSGFAADPLQCETLRADLCILAGLASRLDADLLAARKALTAFAGSLSDGTPCWCATKRIHLINVRDGDIRHNEQCTAAKAVLTTPTAEGGDGALR